jgi:hypothetical protein
MEGGEQLPKLKNTLRLAEEKVDGKSQEGKDLA